MITTLSQLDTPALLLSEPKMLSNIARAQEACRRLGVQWRPHLKTHKCVDIARLQIATPQGPVTVSTVKEAEVFAAAGITDLLYAVGIEPHKLTRLEALNRQGADIKVILDNVEAADLLSAYTREHQCQFHVLIEIDCDGHRSGLKPTQTDAILDVAKHLTDGATLVGVMTHAGGSYALSDNESLKKAAQAEVDAIVSTAELLRASGYTITIVSAGSTPTLITAENATGVTEYRSGVGTFFDLVMNNIGVCSIDEIALSVMVSVIGHQSEKGWVLTDGGWMAMSRDRGTASQKKDWGYGAVCDESGKLMPEYYVSGANQEHCIISRFDGQKLKNDEFPVGRRLRILPNHACPTAAAFDRYWLLDADNQIINTLTRFNHW